MMENTGRYMMAGGVFLILLGGGLYATARLGLPLGRLPGDIRVDWAGGSFYFPVTTSVVISLYLTVLLNLLIRFFRK